LAKIIVHRGTDAIGGTCIEIHSEKGRILLDLGMPLMKNGGGEIEESSLDMPSIENGVLKDVEGLFDGQSDVPILGVLLSHAHPDHYGLLDFVHDDVPIFMSGESQALIEVGNVFLPKDIRLNNTLHRNHIFEQGKPFSLGAFQITPILIDHSAFGASCLLIEVDGKRILYTGDIRAHGRKAYTFKMLPKVAGRVDCMLMEGTTFGGKHHVGFASEDEVEAGFVQEISKQGLTFVQAPGSNIDRLVSLYRACKRTQKVMVIDLYQYYLLHQLKAFSPSLPPHQGDHLRVLFVHSQKAKLEQTGLAHVLEEAKPFEIFPGEIIREAESMVLRLSYFMAGKIIRKVSKSVDKAFIYSMWQGYLQKSSEMNDFPQEFDKPWVHVHTSGHAWLEDLQKLVQKIKPKKLVPIHTLQGDEFANHFANVVRVKDGEDLII